MLTHFLYSTHSGLNNKLYNEAEIEINAQIQTNSNEEIVLFFLMSDNQVGLRGLFISLNIYF